MIETKLFKDNIDNKPRKFFISTIQIISPLVWLAFNNTSQIFYKLFNASKFASIVLSKSSLLCAVEMNIASNCAGGK